MKKNKNILSIISLVIMIACAGLLAACSSNDVMAQSESNSSSYRHGSGDADAEMVMVRSGYYFEEWCDTETGVHYLIYDEGEGSAVTVRYNTDGTLYNCNENKDMSEFDKIAKDGEN